MNLFILVMVGLTMLVVLALPAYLIYELERPYKTDPRDLVLARAFGNLELMSQGKAPIKWD